MAIILQERDTGSGWSVDILSGAQTCTLNFPRQPTTEERDDVIRHYEQLWTDDMVAKYKLDQEESD
jgi:hypothetical protein